MLFSVLIWKFRKVRLPFEFFERLLRFLLQPHVPNERRKRKVKKRKKSFPFWKCFFTSSGTTTKGAATAAVLSLQIRKGVTFFFLFVLFHIWSFVISSFLFSPSFFCFFFSYRFFNCLLLLLLLLLSSVFFLLFSFLFFFSSSLGSLSLSFLLSYQ